MPALGVHQHRVDDMRVALPLEPRPLGPPRDIGAVPPLQHQPLRRRPDRRIGAQHGQFVPGRIRHDGRQMQPVAAVFRHQRLQPPSPPGQRQRPQILAIRRQQIIGHDRRREGRHQLRVDRLAVQPLLQVAEGRHGAVAPDDQFAIHRPLERQPGHHIGEGAGNLVAGAGVQTGDPRLAHRLHPDAVPFPLGGVVGGVELREIRRLVDGRGQHHRPEPPRRLGVRTVAMAFQPGEQIAIGRLQRVPHLLDLRDLHGVERDRRLAAFWIGRFADGGGTHHGGGGLGQTGGQPDPQPPGHQFEQGPPPLGLQRVEPALQQPGHFAATGGAQGVDDLSQLRLPVGAVVGIARPDQGDGLRQVADIIVGPAEQHGIDPRLHRLADHRGLGGGEAQVSRERRQGPAPVGVRRGAQIVPQQDQFRVARSRQRQAIQQFGEGAHPSFKRENAPEVSFQG